MQGYFRQIVHGKEMSNELQAKASCDEVGGDKITLGDTELDHSAMAVGRNAAPRYTTTITTTTRNGLSLKSLTRCGT